MLQGANVAFEQCWNLHQLGVNTKRQKLMEGERIGASAAKSHRKISHPPFFQFDSCLYSADPRQPHSCEFCRHQNQKISHAVNRNAASVLLFNF